jgi:diketogulonate reductase-like aldo/keto reductase
VGLGTWQTFDVAPEGTDPLRDVLRLFAEGGGRLIDSSPMYGRSEAVVGDLARELGLTSDLFMATKVWTRGQGDGIRQMETSMYDMGVSTMDLMQVHNHVDLATHLATLRDWKGSGRIRYVGITHYQVRAFDQLEALIRTEDLDFVQLNYSLAVRDAEDRLLPVAADHGTAVIINRPYEGGSLFRAVRGQSLPEWAAEFDAGSWGQFFLKYLLGAEEVTCVIPATSDPDHLRDNVAAGYGRLPTPDQRQRMVAWFEEHVG